MKRVKNRPENGVKAFQTFCTDDGEHKNHKTAPNKFTNLSKVCRLASSTYSLTFTVRSVTFSVVESCKRCGKKVQKTFSLT